MQKIQLSIPEPCHENWQQMTPTEQGRFCNACAKEVIDFSTMTDTQVLNYFTNSTHEKVCGRALPEQLDTIISRPEQPKKRLFWYWNYLVMFFMVFTKSNAAKAQTCVKPATESISGDNLLSRGQVITKGEVKQEDSSVVAGKITDKEGIPLSFVTIKIKGAHSGVAADANGKFKIEARRGCTLQISGVGYKTTEIVVADQLNVDVTLQSENMVLGGAVMVSYPVYGYTVEEKMTALIQVKDDKTNVSVPDAMITIFKNYHKKADTVFADKKGNYKLKRIKKQDNYLVKIQATGYEPNEFVIDASNIEEGKKEWVVLLKKKEVIENTKLPEILATPLAKINIEKPTNLAQGLESKISGVRINLNDTTKSKNPNIRLGGIHRVTGENQALLVVDDVQMPISYIASINPNDVENVQVLKGAVANALYGSQALNGVIIITTKKIKVKTLDTVAVTGYRITTGKLVRTSTTSYSTVMGGMISGYVVKNKITDSLRTLVTTITDSLKVYPNPVQRNSTFNVALKLKKADKYIIQVSDVTGRPLMQKQIITIDKNYTESLLADNRWSAGIYYIRVFDSNSKLVSKNSFIVQ